MKDRERILWFLLAIVLVGLVVAQPSSAQFTANKFRPDTESVTAPDVGTTEQCWNPPHAISAFRVGSQNATAFRVAFVSGRIAAGRWDYVGAGSYKEDGLYMDTSSEICVQSTTTAQTVSITYWAR